MRSNVLTVLAASAMLCSCNAAQDPDDRPAASQTRLEAHVRFLADDLLEGREAGERGHELAALYVAEQFRANGLVPAKRGEGYFQQVPLLTYQLDLDAENTLEITGGADMALEYGSDYLILPQATATTVNVEAPAVFVGLGYTAADGSRDDFSGIDLEGKIAVFFTDAPSTLSPEERAHEASVTLDRISRAGAAGAIGLTPTDFETDDGFKQYAGLMRAGMSMMTWLDEAGRPYSSSPDLDAYAYASLAGTSKILEAAGLDAQSLFDEAHAGSAPIELGLTFRISSQTSRSATTSPNVVAVLPGSEPDKAGEFVILSAHLDHEGVKPGFEGGQDTIFNGAMDNATGVAALLETSRLLADTPPARSVLFIALTAEEKGLIGSDFYARFPTVARERVVANINLDMPIMKYDFSDVIAYGAERSNLLEPVAAAAKANGLELTPDPDPESSPITRSDQYSWIRQGVPSVFAIPGPASGGEMAHGLFFYQDYHRPSDEASGVYYKALTRFTELQTDIVRNIANMDARPQWNEGDFFATTFPLEETPLATEPLTAAHSNLRHEQSGTPTGLE